MAKYGYALGIAKCTPSPESRAFWPPSTLYDRDYWCDEEIGFIKSELDKHLMFSHIHERKEMENYLLVPSVLERALEKAVLERNRRTGSDTPIAATAIYQALEQVTSALKSETQAKYIAKRLAHFSRTGKDPTSITIDAITLFDQKWNNMNTRMEIVPGKMVLGALRAAIAAAYGVTLTDHRIVSEFHPDEIPGDLRDLLQRLDRYRAAS